MWAFIHVNFEMEDCVENLELLFTRKTYEEATEYWNEMNKQRKSLQEYNVNFDKKMSDDAAQKIVNLLQSRSKQNKHVTIENLRGSGYGPPLAKDLKLPEYIDNLPPEPDWRLFHNSFFLEIPSQVPMG